MPPFFATYCSPIIVRSDTVNEQNRTYRDDQFWFTVAVVAFNTALLGKDVASIPRCARVVASLIVSVLGAKAVSAIYLRKHLIQNFLLLVFDSPIFSLSCERVSGHSLISQPKAAALCTS